MTFIAGALLPDGVLLAADSRVTWPSLSGDVHADHAQKIVRLGDASAFGYAGDIRTVDYLLPHISEQLRKRRSDPISIKQWLPRFIRRAYRALARQYSVGDVAFLVAGSLRNRPTRIPQPLMLALAKATIAIERDNWLLIRCLKELTSGADPVFVPDSSEGLLYAMKAPRFVPEECPQFDVLAIGSGSEVANYLRPYVPIMVAGRPDRAVDGFVDALGGYLVDTGESTVGGMLLMARLENGRVQALCLSSGPESGVEIEQTDRGFKVVNRGTSQEITLLYPSDIVSQRPQSVVFNDLRNALEPERDRMHALRQELALLPIFDTFGPARRHKIQNSQCLW